MQAKKPTYSQRKFIASEGLDTRKWYVQKDCPEFMLLLNVDSGETKKIYK